MVRIGIIGSAGRSGIYTYDNFAKIVDQASKFVNKYENVELVSGGAAGADHIAVILSQIYPLTIFAPCKWDGEEFEDSKIVDWRTNPGGTANYYHRKFEQQTTIPSLKQIKLGVNTNKIKIEVGKGFHDRNTKIADCDILLAFTFDGIDGGTLDTWNKCKNSKFHFHI